jgi:Ca2+-binding RTX toxin-like protein
MQGIFLADETGTLPYQNVAISGNLLVGTNWNGIAVLAGNTAAIKNNVIASTADQRSWVRVKNATDVVVTDNQAGDFLYDPLAPPTQSGNVILFHTSEQVAQLIEAWRALHDAAVDVPTPVPDAQAPAPAAPLPPEVGVVLTGDDLDNSLVGTGYNDEFFGKGGADTIEGGAGNDKLDGGSGVDKMAGGLGDDIYTVSDKGDQVIELAGGGADLVYASVSYALQAHVEGLILTGTAADGWGNELANVLSGNAGNNKLYGAVGNDVLCGGDGADTLYGGDGNDLIDGGAGRDRASGGLGADTFVFRDGDLSGRGSTTCDHILDFSKLQGDRLSLVGIDANIKLDGDQAFTFIAGAEFSGAAGELRYGGYQRNTYVQGDVNGDGVADFAIRLDGLHTLVMDNFIF